MNAIWQDWLPSSGYEVPDPSGDVPDMLECYGENFNPQTGMGDIEVWVPVKPGSRK
jgi:AraC family transcriptional regulator